MTLLTPDVDEVTLFDYKNLMKAAIGFARQSPDMSTQNAAVLLKGDGPQWLLEHTWAVNEFPRGVAYTDERWERPTKYAFIAHAEANTILSAARQGICTDGLTLLAVWAACSDCGKSIIQAGIKRLVTLRPTQAAHGGWDDSIKVAMTMFEEAGVEVVFLDGPLHMPFTIRRNGEDVYF